MWVCMRPTGVWMVSVDQDHTFPNQHVLQLGIRVGFLAVVSNVHCVRVVCCAALLEGRASSITDPFRPMIVEKSFRLLI